MARSRKVTPQTATVTQFPSPEEGGIAVEDPPEGILPEPEQIASPPPPRTGAGRPKKVDPAVQTNFFDRVAAVPAGDWGTRVYLYLYILEPVCNLKQSGGKSYLMRYEEPITDEHRIMVEHGSGKYRFMLALNKYNPTPNGEPITSGNALAQYDFEIYNTQYPPKIPKEAWVNDSRNRRWEALLPKPAPAPAAGAQSGLSDFVEVLRTANEIRKDVREELQASAPAPQPAAAPVAAAPAADPFVSAMGLAKEILQMRTSENPMVDILRDELKAMREELRDERAENRRLQTATAPAGPQKSFLEQAIEFAGAAEKLKPIAAAFGFAPAAGAAVEGVRTGRTTLLDVAREVIPEIVNSDLAKGIGYKLMTSGATAPPGSPPPVVINGSAPNPDEFTQFMTAVVTPAVLTAIEAGDTGSEFAEWMERGFGTEKLQALQNFTHPMLPGLRGEHAIIAGFQHTKAWEYLKTREEQFRVFVREFCIWNPEADPAAPPAAPETSVDFDAEYAASEEGKNS